MTDTDKIRIHLDTRTEGLDVDGAYGELVTAENAEWPAGLSGGGR